MNIAKIKNSSIHLDSTIKGDLSVSVNGSLTIRGQLIGKLENYGKVIVIGSINGIIINHVGAELIVEETGMINGELLDNFGVILLQGEIQSPCNNYSSGVIQNSGSLATILQNLGSIS